MDGSITLFNEVDMYVVVCNLTILFWIRHLIIHIHIEVDVTVSEECEECE